MPVLRGDRYSLGRPYDYLPDYYIIVGVSVDDLMFGTAEADVIHGGYGHNVIHGGGGDDQIHVNGGSDVPTTLPWSVEVINFLGSAEAIGHGALYGDAGDDILTGGAKADTLDGGGDNDSIYGGGGDDIIHASTGYDRIDGGAGFDTLRATADGDIRLADIGGVELISAGGFRNVGLVGSSARQSWNFTNIALSGITHIAGGGGGDWIVGTAGRDVISVGGSLADSLLRETVEGGAGDDLIRLLPTARNNAMLSGGTGADMFDLTLGGTQPLGLGSLRVLGTGLVSTVVDDSDVDTVLLPGSPDDYEVSWSRLQLDSFNVNDDQSWPFAIVSLDDIQKLRFTGKLANQIRLGEARIDGASADANLIVEQSRLLEENYPLFQTGNAEEMGYVVGWDTDEAAERGWHRLSALELQMAPKASIGDIDYVMDLGQYLATTPNSILGFDDPPQAVATVLAGIVNGKRTLAVTFRGTDQHADWLDYVDFGDHYRKLAPLVAAIDAYVADPANGIEQVLLSGHSLGGAMVQEFMAQHRSGPPGIVYRGVTVGSPGSDNPERMQADSRIINFGHSDDIVFQIGFGDNELVAEAAALALADVAAPELVRAGVEALMARVEDKHRQGPSVTINVSRDTEPLLGEHHLDLYSDSLQVLVSFAYDSKSPFSRTALAAALRDSTPYSGPDLHIAVINSGTRAAWVGASDGYALGSESNDTFHAPRRAGQVIDGGLGAGDKVVVFDPLGSLTWQRAGERVLVWEGGRLALDLTRVEAIVRVPGQAPIDLQADHADGAGPAAPPPAPSIPAPLTFFDGRAPAVQSATAGATLTLRSDVDYALTGRAASVRGTEGNDFIVVNDAAGRQTISLGGGDDLVMVMPGAIAAGGEVRISGYGGNDTLINAGASAGAIVFELGYRSSWAVTLDGQGDATLTRLVFDSLERVRLIGNILVKFGEDAAPVRLTQSFVPLFGNDSGNRLEAPDQASFLFGGGGNDLSFGSDFGDVLKGLDGRDELHGGLGDDLYTVDGDDLIFEQADGGIDTIYAVESYVMPENVENLRVITAAPLAVVGNAEDNVISAPLSGTYDLRGAGGNDSIHAGDRNDILAGDGGDDLLDGGMGADSLDGGAGRDWLISGDGADALAGGTEADSVWGGPGDDLLDGGPGDDTIVGNEGGDTVSYAAATARVEVDLTRPEDQNTRGAGVDTLVSIEHVIGSGFGDSLAGDAGANRLDGKGGADVLIGYSGADLFAFTAALGGGNVDRIADFASGVDKIALGNAVFALGFGALNPNAFFAGSAAHDGDDRIVHNRTTGALFFDADGNGAGAAIQFAAVTPGLALTANDFIGI